MATLTEDFEDTTYVVPISGDWVRTDLDSRTGSWSLGAVDALEDSTDITLPAGVQTVRFWYNGNIDDFSLFSVELDGVSAGDFPSTGGSWVQSPLINALGRTTLNIFAGSFATSTTVFIDDLVITTPDVSGEFFAWGIPI